MGPYVTEALSHYRSCEPGRSLRNKATVADVRKKSTSDKGYNIAERNNQHV